MHGRSAVGDMCFVSDQSDEEANTDRQLKMLRQLSPDLSDGEAGERCYLLGVNPRPMCALIITIYFRAFPGGTLKLGRRPTVRFVPPNGRRRRRSGLVRFVILLTARKCEAS